MKIFKRLVCGIIGIFTFLIFGLIFFTPIINDNVAKEVARSIREIQLPDNTEYVESFFQAGKLAGNGNGMQYLGGILIKSDCTLQDLQAYYSQHEQDELAYIVEEPAAFLQHEYIALNENIEKDGYYIVYSWGFSDSLFAELDIRGH